MSYFTYYEHQYSYNCKKFKNEPIFRFPSRAQLYSYIGLSLHEAQEEQHKNMNVSYSPFIVADQQFVRKAAADLLCNV